MGWLVGISIFLLNLFDGLFTQLAISNGAFELNPLIKFSIDTLGIWWLIPKVSFGLIAGILFGLEWDKFKLAKIGALIILVVYSLLFLYHIYILLNIFL